MSTNSQTIAQADPKRWKALALLGFANFMVMMDSAIIQVALPAIKETLGYTQQDLQWVMTAFLIFFGGLLLLGGRLSDLFGHRRIFMWGFSILTVASLLAGLAWDDVVLNVARAVQGVGSALIAPAALSIVMILFSANPKELSKALALWGLSGAAGGSIGIVLGGILTEFLSWRWALLIYVPIGIIILLLSPGLLQKGKRLSGRIDYAGAISVTAALVLLVYGIANAEHSGWGSSSTVWSLSVGAMLFIIFIVIQAIKKEPLVPLRIFKTRNLSIGNISLVLLSTAWVPIIYFLVLYLQLVLKFAPFSAAMALLPAPIFMAVFVVAVAGKTMEKLGLKITMVIGFLILGGSGLLFSLNTPVNGDYWTSVLLALLLAALGNALAYLPATTAAVSNVKAEESGLASGLYNTTYQIGSAVGLAIMVAIAAATTESRTAGDAIVALNEGFQQAFLWSGIVALAGAVLALLFVRSQKQSETNAPK
ncbi:EmrB/QacA subfamily drug resistance transporter [Neobacillus niacini]|jgi:EmrB/QacA subfamily drug resistance transporter|uniref:DHA2 family efflux MFS transporter permease subunit n=1 Tax=Neobacillus niacini TaxID=86668 RepID=UPI00278128E8|nr:DHA2 family efflux MFS transporter permease subunit [Neobacillus niacini]MDQ1002842.1 EmrB/QacA subfamily drug resistance transporter [Neobacillus niacini]